MTNGWIKLHRTLLEKAIFTNPHVLQVFLYCLMMAAYKDMKLAVGNQTVVLCPGQLLYGSKSVSRHPPHDMDNCRAAFQNRTGN